MQITANTYRGAGPGAGIDPGAEIPLPSVNADAPRALLSKCPDHAVTPLVQHGNLWIKDERSRMGLGSFKALGAAYVIACDAQSGAARGRTYVTASAGNHGLSVAAGARIFGAKSVIYLAQTVPASFADRLRAEGAEVVVEGAEYEASMAAAAQAAARNGWILLSDSSWAGYTELPHRLMEGYLVMAAEAAEQMPGPPSHIFLQAGVGGLAGACAAYFRSVWGQGPHITVVEPVNAPALYACITAGRFVTSAGPASEMGRLDCKEASLIALKGLSRDADAWALLTETEGRSQLAGLASAGLSSTPSGAAGVTAALLSDLPASASALCILSEAA